VVDADEVPEDGRNLMLSGDAARCLLSMLAPRRQHAAGAGLLFAALRQPQTSSAYLRRRLCHSGRKADTRRRRRDMRSKARELGVRRVPRQAAAGCGATALLAVWPLVLASWRQATLPSLLFHALTLASMAP